MKLVVGLFALMLAIAAASLLIWRRSPPQPPCEARDIGEVPSPDGSAQADIFEVRCGNSLSTHVALRPRGAPLRARADVFISAGAVRARLEWNGPRQLTVEAPLEHVLAEETRWRNVVVRVRRIR